MTEGPPVIYIPMIRSAVDYPQDCIGGPWAYHRVDEVTECPIIVEPSAANEGGDDA